MNRIILIFAALLISGSGFAQTDSEKALAKGKSFMQLGDYSNAVIVLYLASQKDPENMELSKNLSLCYYYQHNYQNALDLIQQQLKKSSADDQCYLIASDIYQQTNQLKEAEKLIKKGLKKFPTSGPLYNNLGEVQFVQNKSNAIESWETGMEKDPSYGRNYYNAARYYFKKDDLIKALLFGEIFVNIDPQSQHTPEMKGLILKGWRQLFSPDKLKLYAKLEGFEGAFFTCVQQHAEEMSSGVNTESLTMLRSLFILDWFKDFAASYPFQLFSYHQQLLQEGYFESYQQWLFGAAENLSEFQKWTIRNRDDYQAFIKTQQNRMFKIKMGQLFKN